MKFIPSCLILIVALGLYGCKSNPVEPTSAKITTGASVDLVTQSVPSSGGTIRVNKPGDSLNGLTIDVPNRAYPDARNFHISYAPITHHEFGSDFNVLTPLITIENGGGYADSLMTLRIPVKVPKGQFAMAFLYDRQSGRLEGMPLLEADSDHVTIITANFDYALITSLGKRNVTGVIADGNSNAQIVVASTPETALNANATTGFDPRVDSWQIPDTATYVSRNGLSPGESFSAAWYYVVRKKKLGQPSLFGRYDNDGVRKTPTLWQDDVGAIKLCSKLSVKAFAYFQHSLEFYHDVARNFPNWRQGRSIVQQLAYSMRETGDPQLLLIAGPVKRRMVVAYEVSNGSLVRIYDPALPGISATLEYDATTGRFKPYSNAGTFTEVYYEGLSSITNWRVPVDDFRALDARTTVDDPFPSFSLMARDSTDNVVPLVDGFKVTGSQLTMSVNGVGFSGEFDVYNEQGTKFSKNGSTVMFPCSTKAIGVHVMDDQSSWVGFKWVQVEGPGHPCVGSTFDFRLISIDESGNQTPELDTLRTAIVFAVDTAFLGKTHVMVGLEILAHEPNGDISKVITLGDELDAIGFKAQDFWFPDQWALLPVASKASLTLPAFESGSGTDFIERANGTISYEGTEQMTINGTQHTVQRIKLSTVEETLDKGVLINRNTDDVTYWYAPGLDAMLKVEFYYVKDDRKNKKREFVGRRRTVVSYSLK